MFFVQLFLLSACMALSPTASAAPYTFDPAEYRSNWPVMAMFTRGDGAVVKLYEVDADGVIASMGSDCVIEIEGQQYSAPHDANDGGTRCIAVSRGDAAEIYFFSNQVLGIPFATQVMQFDGYRFERVAGVGKRLASPFVHVRHHLEAYLTSVAILAAMGMILWGLFKITPKRKWWWVLQGIWFAAGGVMILLYLSLMMMSGFHSLLIPVAILSAVVVSLRMAWKFVRGRRANALAA
jgi:hypothetical protein